MTANYRTADDNPMGDVTADPTHDAVYSNADRQREHLREKGYDEEEIDEILAEEEPEDEEGNVQKAREEYERVDDALFEAYEKSVWWGLGAEDNGVPIALEKAPGIWTDGAQVPDYVQELIEEVIRSTNWDWEDFESLDASDVDDLRRIVEETLTQSDGWTIGELSQRLEDDLGLDQGTALGIARDTSHSVLNTTREEAYEQMEGSEEFEYSWIGPDDDDTTPTCEEIKAEISNRGGAVSMGEMKDILREKAEKYKNTREGGGTPDRVDEFEPHFQCRHTFVREVR